MTIDGTCKIIPLNWWLNAQPLEALSLGQQERELKRGQSSDIEAVLYES